MPWISKFHLDYSAKTVTIPYAAGTDVETKAIREQLKEGVVVGRVDQKTRETRGRDFVFLDERAEGEVGLLQPATHRLYNIELEADMVRKPKDGEVEEFYL
ncbi:MAG: hypothetical protein Q9161_002629 [Pseudevernia consocians]